MTEASDSPNFALLHEADASAGRPSIELHHYTSKFGISKAGVTEKESLNTSLSPFVFLSNIVTFLIFLNMSTLASHALFTPSEILLRSNGGRNVFFMFQFEKSP